MANTTEYHIFLEKLRRSGITNMFGSAPYIEEHFGVSRAEAIEILKEWMNTYDPNDSDYSDIPEVVSEFDLID